MKTQLLDNVTSWIVDDRLAAIILQSWESALREEPETASVDDNLGPVHCYFFFEMSPSIALLATTCCDSSRTSVWSAVQRG